MIVITSWIDACAVSNFLPFLCLQLKFHALITLNGLVYDKLVDSIPGFDVIMQKVAADFAVRRARGKERLKVLQQERKNAYR